MAVCGIVVTFAPMNVRWSVFLILFGLIVAACGGDYERRLQQLYQLQADNRADSLMTNDTLARDLVDYFDRHGTPNDRLLAYYLLGRTYSDLGQVPQALETYRTAATKADTTAADCDFATLSRVHGQTANLFYYQLLPDNAVKEYRQALRYAQLAKDTMMYIGCYAMLGEGYEIKNMPDSSLCVLLEAYHLYYKVGADNLAAGLGSSIADLYRLKKDYQTAEQFMQEYETCSGYFDDDGNVEQGKEIYYYLKGLLCLDVSKPKEAEYFFRKLDATATTYDNKVAALDGLKKLYKKYFNKDSLMKYDGLHDSLCSIVHNDVEVQKTLQVQAMYDYTHSEKIAHEKQQEADQLRQSLTNATALLVILALLFIIFYIRHLNAKRLLESKYQSEQEKLAQAQTDLLALRSEQSVSEELLNQKEQEIKKLQTSVEQYRKKVHTLQSYAVNERLQQAPVTRRLKQYLKESPYRLPEPQDWSELKQLINQELPSFYNELVGTHGLNGFEYDVCMLLRIQISPANIAKLKKCSAPYITQIRKGIYEKIFQEAAPAEELDNYINSLT